MGWGLLAGIAAPRDARGATVNVSSVPALQSAVNSAAAGDILVLADGTYTNSTLTLGKSNITVRSATPGGVFLNGTQSISITGDFVTFSGFQFTSGDIGSGFLIEIDGDHNLLSQLNFKGYLAQKYIRIQEGTVSNEVAYCNIENKPTNAVINCTIQISTSPTIPGYHKIRYCSFRHFPGLGGDYGNEPIRIGLSTEMTNISRTVVEYCYFEDVGLGDSESISIKSSENVCRYNTFAYNPDGMLVFRHGYRSIAYGNFFVKGSGGIRIKEGANHCVYNNYFETGTADALTLQYVAEFPLTNINFLHNTFVNSGAMDLGGTGPAAITFANNIFKKSSGSIFTNPNGGTSWAGNIYNGTLGITKPAFGLTSADPKLVLNSDGYYGLASNSPAINAASTNCPAIIDIAGIDDDPSLLLDISGQSRPATATLKDVGCDEFTTGTTINRPLTLSDVGPSYLGGPVVAVPPLITTQPQSQTVNVGAPVAFSVVATATAPLGYQWRKDGTNISGAAGTNYNIASAQPANAGSYTVVVTNVAGSVTSAVATLTVNTVVTSTNVLLEDRWLDVTRTDTLLPTDAAWYASAAATLVAATNSLIGLPDPAATMTWWTYFTANTLSPVSLGVSDTLRITLAFTPGGLNAGNSSRGLRIGLYNSMNGTRTPTDGAAPNGANSAGYMLSMNIGQIFGGNYTMQFLERTNLSSSNLIGTVNDYSTSSLTSSSGGPVVGTAGFSNGVPYVLELTVKRNSGSVDLTATFTATNAWSASFTCSDTNNFASAFDTFVFRPALQAQTATNFTFTEFKVEVVATNNHPPVAALHSAVTAQDTTLFLGVTNLLATDSDPDGDALRLAAVSPSSTNSGRVSLAKGTITYIPPAGYAGADLLSYTLTDLRGASSTGFIAVTVVPRPGIVDAAVTNGAFRIEFTGAPGSSYVIQAKADLSDPDWLTIATNVTDNSGFSVFTDASLSNCPSRFYRVAAP